MRWSTLGYAAGGVLSGGGFGLVFVVRRYERQVSNRRAESADVVVILGARVRGDGSPSAALVARVRQGCALYRKGDVRALILTGGGATGQVREAAVMRRLALEEGIPASALHLEDQSRDTGENARFVRPLLERLGARRVTVVTDGFHAFRTRQTFRLETGLEVQVSPTPREGRFFSALEHFAATVREALALWARPTVLLARRRASRLPEV